jgi:dihydroflavonol-4-reductase
MLKELFALIAKQARRRGPKLRLPIAPLMPIAAVMERIAAKTGRPPLMTREMLQMARKTMFFSSAKAMRELGYATRPAAEAVADALDWFSTQGMMK